MKERLRKMIKIIEKKDNSYYNSNSLNNYMKVKRENYIKEYDYNSEKEMYLSFKIGRINRQKKKIEELKKLYKDFMRLFNSRQLDLLNYKSEYEYRNISEHLEYLKLKRKSFENEIRIAEKELYDLTHSKK